MIRQTPLVDMNTGRIVGLVERSVEPSVPRVPARIAAIKPSTGPESTLAHYNYASRPVEDYSKRALQLRLSQDGHRKQESVLDKSKGEELPEGDILAQGHGVGKEEKPVSPLNLNPVRRSSRQRTSNQTSMDQDTLDGNDDDESEPQRKKAQESAREGPKNVESSNKRSRDEDYSDGDDSKEFELQPKKQKKATQARGGPKSTNPGVKNTNPATRKLAASTTVRPAGYIKDSQRGRCEACKPGIDHASPTLQEDHVIGVQT